MSIWNNSTPMARFVSWRQHREEIKEKPLEDAINAIVDYWSTCPRGARNLDYYSPETWPLPWEILGERLYCYNTISLMMHYTLNLTHPEAIVKMYLIDTDQDEYVIPVVNNNTLLNYDLHSTVDFTSHKQYFKIIHKIDTTQIPEII